MSHGFSVRIIDDLRDLDLLEDAWTTLLARSESQGFFLTWEWLHQRAHHYIGHHRLWVLLMHDAEHRLCAIAPFYIRRVRPRRGVPYREVAFLGTEDVGSSYLDIITTREQKVHVWECLVRFLFHEVANEWDVLALEQVPVESSTVETLLRIFDEQGKVAEIVRHTACPVITLPLSCTDYRTGLTVGRRAGLRRKRRLLERMGVVASRHVHIESEMPGAFERFIGLHEARWMNRGAHGGAFQRPRFPAFHRDIVRIGARRGWLNLSFLTVDDRPVAGIYGFVHHGTYYFYLPGFDPTVAAHASPGILLLHACIEWAIEQRLHRFDLLQGVARYKTELADRTACALTLRAYNRHGRAWLLKAIESAVQTLKIMSR